MTDTTVTTTSVAIPEPPRFLGNNVEHNFQAMQQYVWDLYKAMVFEGAFVQPDQIGAQLQAQYERIYNLAVLEDVVADTLPYFTGEFTWAHTPFTTFARSLLDDETSDDVLITLGIYNFINDPELLSLGALSSAADKFPYFTGPGSAALADLSAFTRTLTGLADQAAWQAALGIGAGPVLLSDIEDITDGTLLGRSAGSDGPPMEIAVGSGLTLSGGTLEATAVPSSAYVPLTDGAQPPALIDDGNGSLIFVAYSP